MKWIDLPIEVREAIDRHVSAQINVYLKGGMEPASWPEINFEAREAKKALVTVLVERLNA